VSSRIDVVVKRLSDGQPNSYSSSEISAARRAARGLVVDRPGGVADHPPIGEPAVDE
jgi:hypothetical protein